MPWFGIKTPKTSLADIKLLESYAEPDQSLVPFNSASVNILQLYCDAIVTVIIPDLSFCCYCE